MNSIITPLCNPPCCLSCQLNAGWHQKYPLLCRVPGKKTFREITLKKLVIEENVGKYSVLNKEKWKLFS